MSAPTRRSDDPLAFLAEASIAAVHCEASSWDTTDWPQILALYDLLSEMDRSPVVKLNRAIALSHVEGAEAALQEVDATSPTLVGYHLYHATRAVLLRQLGRQTEADLADTNAINLTRNEAEKELMARRLTRDGDLIGMHEVTSRTQQD